MFLYDQSIETVKWIMHADNVENKAVCNKKPLKNINKTQNTISKNKNLQRKGNRRYFKKH